MSRIFVNVVRRSMRSLQAPLSCKHVNVERVVIEREYSKVSRPKYVADFNADDLLNDGAKEKRMSRKHKRYNSKPKALKIKDKAQKIVTANTPKGPLTYTSFLDNEDPIVQFMSKLHNKRQRNFRSNVILEGKVLIADAIKAGCVLKTVLFSRLQDILSLELPKDVTLYRTKYRTLQLWSTLTTSPGIMGVFEKPNLESRPPAPDALPLTIICNNIRDPGNLGSILRNAATVGCEKLIITKGCVDLWSPKVLRAASGAHFFMPISADQPWKDIVPQIMSDANIYIADNTTTFDGDVEVDSASNFTSAKSNAERSSIASGDDDEDDDDGNVDDDYEDDDTDDDDADDEDDRDDYDEEGKAKEMIKNTVVSKEQRHRLMQQVLHLKSQVPVVPYHTVDFTNNHNVLVIGGETEGVSLELLCYFPNHKTVRVNIPLSNGFDSLNTSTAAGILAFEIKRQILSKENKPK